MAEYQVTIKDLNGDIYYPLSYKLYRSRNVKITGGVTSETATFDGSADLTLNVTSVDSSKLTTVPYTKGGTGLTTLTKNTALTVNSSANGYILRSIISDKDDVTSSATGLVSGAAVNSYVTDAISTATTTIENHILNQSDAMRFKGTIGTGGTVTVLPTSGVKVGDTYKVKTAGTYASQKCEVGDMIIADSATPTWTVIQTNIDGAVTGPTSSTDGYLALFNGTTGKTLKQSQLKGNEPISISGTTITHNVSGVTANTYGSNSNQSLTSEGTFTMPFFTVNAQGHITSAGTRTLTMPKLSSYTGVNPITITGSQISHEDSGVTNGSYGPASGSNATLIKGGTFNVPYVTVDKKGHVTSIKNVVLTMPSADASYEGTSPITVSDTIISHANSGVTANTYGSASTNSVKDATVVVPAITVNATGHVTKVENKTLTFVNFKGATSSAAGTTGLVPAPASGDQAKFLRADGTWVVPTNTTYETATTSSNGLMTAAMVTKLNGIAASANNYSLPTASSSTLGGVKTGAAISSTDGYTAVHIKDGVIYYKDTNTVYSHPTTSGNKHIPSGGSSGQILKWSSDGTAKWANEYSYSHPTTSGNKHIPSGGASGQILKWSADGTAAWANEYSYSHPTTSGNKHIPSGGATGNALIYGGSSGTASWGAPTGTITVKNGNTSIVTSVIFEIV